MTPVRALGRMRLGSPAIVAGFLALGAILTVTELGQTSGTRGGQPSAIARDTSGASSEVAFIHSEAVSASETVALGAAPARSPGELRVAKSWTHVRKGRSRSADLEAVLTPGDTVFADSLQRGWYRVALDGEVLGYANESMLTPTEPGHP